MVHADGTVLVRESFPVGSGRYSDTVKKLNESGNTQGSGIEGVTSDWKAGGDTGTGVFWTNPSPGLSFPAAFPRTPAGSGTVSFKHSESSAKPNDYGRSLARRTDSAVSGVDTSSGVVYMSVLVQLESGINTAIFSGGHWRMMGMAKTAPNSVSSSALMTSGVYLGLAKIDGSVVNALKVGSQFFAISPATVGQTHFLLARIDFDAGKVYAREVTAPFVDEPSNYAVEAPFGDFQTTGLFSYLVIGGDYPSSNKNTYFDEFLLSTDLGDHTGIASGVYTLGEVTVSDVTGTTATVSVEVAGLGSGGTLVIECVDNSTGAVLSRTAQQIALGTNTLSFDNLVTASSYTATARIVDGNGETLAESQPKTFGTSGTAELGVPTAEVQATDGGRALHLSVELVQAGLAPTTVAFLLGTYPDALSPISTSSPSSAPFTYEADVSGLLLGQTYYYAATATFTDGGRTVTTSTDTYPVFYTGTETWLNTTGDGLWGTAANWNEGQVPTAHVNASFQTVGGNIVADADIAVSNLAMQCGNNIRATLDLDGHALAVGGTLQAGTGSARGMFTVANGSLNADIVKIGGTGSSVNSSLTLDAAQLAARQTTLGNTQGTHTPNYLIVTNGASASVGAMTIGISNKEQGNVIRVHDGCSFSFGSVYFSGGSGSSFLADHAAVTGSGTFTVVSRGSNGTYNNRVTVDNGSTWTSGNLDFDWYNGCVLVAGGSTMTVPNVRIGVSADQGSGNKVIVSNATLNVSGNLFVPNDNRFRSNSLLVYEDEGETAIVSVGGDVQIGRDSARTGDRNRDNRMAVRGGDVTIKEWLLVGGRSPDDTGNTLVVGGRTTRIRSKYVTLRNRARLRFEIPEEGFDDVPLAATDSSRFENSTLEIDVTTAPDGRHVLFSAPIIYDGFADEDIAVTARGNQAVHVFVNENDDGRIVVRVSGTPTLVLFQ